MVTVRQAVIVKVLYVVLRRPGRTVEQKRRLRWWEYQVAAVHAKLYNDRLRGCVVAFEPFRRQRRYKQNTAEGV